MWNNVKLLNTIASLLMLLAVLISLTAACVWFVQRPMFVITEVEVSGTAHQDLRHVSAIHVKAAALKQLPSQSHALFGSARSFFVVPLESVRENFEQVPWVRHASVRRIWPDRLQISLEEHKVAAAWGDGRLVNLQGELFSANLAEAEEDGPLPQFSGPEDSSQQVLRRYHELVKWLSPLNVRPESLTLSSRHAWTVKLDDGITLLLGREQGVAMEDRITNWVQSVPRLQAKLTTRPELFDLRYPNGFAVRNVALVDDPKTLKSTTEGRE